MKNLLLLAGLLAAGISAQAQVTPEAVLYGNAPTAAMVKLNGDMKYVTQGPTGQAYIYNLNHSVYKQLTPPAVSGYDISYIFFVSDALFDTSVANVEYMAYYGVSGNPDAARTIVYSENGGVIATLDSVSSYGVKFYNTSAGSKMITSPGGSTRPYTRVYGLAGTYMPLKTTGAATQIEGSVYPNPGRTGAPINLPYQLTAGQRAALEVLDMTGRVVRSFAVAGGTFDHLLLSPADLPAPGAYVYRIVPANGGAATVGKRFVVQ